MILLNSFDPYQNFWESNPQMRIIFSKEYEAHTPSPHMWALFLFAHPSSKFFNETPSTRKMLIEQDYLKDPSFSWENYASSLQIIDDHILTKAQRSLMR